MITCALCALLSVAVPGQAIEAQLKWRDFGPQDKRTAPIMSFYGFQPSPTHSLKPPKAALQPKWFTLTMGATPIEGCLAKSTTGGQYDQLWVDWDRDGKIESREKGARGPGDPRYGQSSIYSFDPPPVGPNGRIRVKLLVVTDSYVGVMPTGWMEGTVRIGGAAYKVAVADTNGNGTFGDAWTSSQGDYMLLEPASGPTPAGRQGLLPIYSVMQLPDGRFFQPRFSKDGSRVELLEDNSPLGTIQVRGGSLQNLNVYGPKGPMNLSAQNGEVKVPAGSYRLSYASLSLSVGDAKPWTVSISGGPNSKLEVPANGTYVLEVGGPLKGNLSANGFGASHSFSLAVSDKAGNPISGLYGPNMQRPKEPVLKIADPSGKVVQNLTFAYG